MDVCWTFDGHHSIAFSIHSKRPHGAYIFAHVSTDGCAAVRRRGRAAFRPQANWQVQKLHHKATNAGERGRRQV